MRIVCVNPNSTDSMTALVAETARMAAGPDVEIVALTNRSGPPAIQGIADGVAAIPGMLDLIRQRDDADAFVIACFDDTGLDAARCVARTPVIGIGEAGCHTASLVSHRFSIVTTLARSVPILPNNLDTHGLSRKCASILASGVPVLALENAAGELLEQIDATIRLAIERDGAEAIVLGCAGMAGMTERLSRIYGIPVIDGIASAVGLATSLVRM